MAVANRSAMACRMEPTVCLPKGRRAKGSGEMLSFSVSTRNAEINEVSCEMSIINQSSFADFTSQSYFDWTVW